MAAVSKHTHWKAWQRAGTEATIAETSTPEWGRWMRRVKGARHAHATIRASGRIPGAEARRELAHKRKIRKRDAEEGKSWRVGYTDMGNY